MIGVILGLAEKLIDKLIPDPKQKAEALQTLKAMEQSGDLQVISNQVQIALVEAGNPRMFVSGARPFIMWVCGAALAFQLVIGPVAVWGAALAGRNVPPPIMQTELLTTLLVGMLGLGGMRTVEKLNGVASK